MTTHNHIPTAQLADRLGVSQRTITHRARRAGLKPAGRVGRCWLWSEYQATLIAAMPPRGMPKGGHRK